MTRKEFASEIQVRDKRFYRAWFAGLTLAGFWMISAPILDILFHFNQSKFLAQAWAGAGGLGAVLFLIVLLAFGGKRGVRCQHCGKQLFGIPGQIAVATGHCGYCGEKAFE